MTTAGLHGTCLRSARYRHIKIRLHVFQGQRHGAYCVSAILFKRRTALHSCMRRNVPTKLFSLRLALQTFLGRLHGPLNKQEDHNFVNASFSWSAKSMNHVSGFQSSCSWDRGSDVCSRIAQCTQYRDQLVKKSCTERALLLKTGSKQAIGLHPVRLYSCKPSVFWLKERRCARLESVPAPDMHAEDIVCRSRNP